MKAFLAMVKARTMEFVRDRGTFLWNLFFPLVLVLGFAFALPGSGSALFKIGVVGGAPGAPGAEPAGAFLKIEGLEIIRYQGDKNPGLERVLDKLRQHKLDMVLDADGKRWYVNTQAKNVPILRRLWNAEPLPGYTEAKVTGDAVRYVDWLAPGVIGMNVVMSCMWGVGYLIVRYRKNGVLKRLKATPVKAWQFIAAQAASRFLIVILTAVTVFLLADLLVGFPVKGSPFLLLLVASLGITSMLSLGLLFAARFKSDELAGGLINLVTFPMIIFSGVFFSLEGAPAGLQAAAQALPLTHFLDGARAVMLEGAGLAAVAPQLLFLAGFTFVFLAVAAASFRWE